MNLAVGTASGLRFLGSERKPLFGGAVVNGLVPDDGGLLALIDGNSLQRIDGDEPRGLARSEELRLNCAIATATAGVFVGASEARLLRLEDGELRPVAAFDTAEGRDEWFTPWGGPPDVRSVAAAPSGALFANVHVGGILRSDDDGGSWRQTIDIRADVHEVVASGDSDLLLAATARGLATSEDGGADWTFSTDGLHADYCRAVALMGEILFLTASIGPRGGRAAIYRRALDASTFEKCEGGLPEWFGDNIDTGRLVVSGNEVAFGTSDGSIFLSQDGGDSWEQIAQDLPAVRSVAVVP